MSRNSSLLLFGRFSVILQAVRLQDYRFFGITTVLVVLCFVSSCKTNESEKESHAAAEQAQTHPYGGMKIPVGKVHLVDPEGRFLLIRSSRTIPAEAGAMITLVNDAGATVATARVSPARRGAFLSADILSGDPLVGQRALMDFSPKASEASPAGPPEPSDEIQVLE